MSSKRIFHQKNGKRVFIKETRKYAKRKTRELAGKRAVSKQVNTKHCQRNMTKNRKNDFMEERHKYAKRKKRESSEKRAVFKQRHKYATHKKMEKNKKSSKMALS